MMKKQFLYLFSVLALVAAFSLGTPSKVEAQCPMCKAAVTTGSNYGEKTSKMADGLNTGILYLFAIPYVVIMSVGFLYYRGLKKKKKEESLLQQEGEMSSHDADTYDASDN